MPCIKAAKSFLQSENISGEIIIADNGSTDDSVPLAEAHDARVVHVSERGYGAAILGGLQAAKGKYVVIGDADMSYDFSSLSPFVNELRKGSELVIGNRFQGGIKKGAMPFLHRYLGNPVLSFIGRLFYHAPVGDFHCGLRAARRDALLSLNLQCPGMEFASEMIAKASLFGLTISEVPTTLSPDGRSRAPHLRTWRDGWRHLVFLLLLAPRWLFLYPGFFLAALGLLMLMLLSRGPISVFGAELDIHTLLYAAMAVLISVQLILFYRVAISFSERMGLRPEKQRSRTLSLELMLLIALISVAAGFSLGVYSFLFWRDTGFADLSPGEMMRRVIPSVLFLGVGVQVLFSAFLFSLLEMKSPSSISEKC